MEKYIYSDAIAFIKFYSDTKLLECLVGGVGGNITKDELLKVIDFDSIVKVELVEFDEDTQLHYKMVKYSEIEFTQDLEIFKNENLEYSHKEYYDYLKLTDTVEPTENDKKVVGSTPTNFEKKDSKMKKVNLKNVVITEDNISDYYEFMSDDELLEHSSLISTVFYYRYNDLYKVRIYDNGKHGKYFKLPQRENTKILFSEKFKDNNGYDNYKLSPSTPPILELNDVHLLHDGLSPVGLTIFGVKDTLKPLDDYILEIKESVSYKAYMSSLSDDNTIVDVATISKLLIKEFGITEDTLQLHQLKGYKKAIAFTKEWYHKKEFLTFNSNDDFTEISVNIRSCSVC